MQKSEPAPACQINPQKIKPKPQGEPGGTHRATAKRGLTAVYPARICMHHALVLEPIRGGLLEIIFLGTSSGMPTRQRNVSGIALRRKHRKTWYLIDCGEGSQHQLLHTNLSLNNLEAIFITHIHGDHCYGLPGLLATAATRGRVKPLILLGPERIKSYIDGVCESTALHLPYAVHFHPVERQHTDFITGDYSVKSVELSHRVPSYGYLFTETACSAKLNSSKLKALGMVEGPEWGQLLRGENVVSPAGELLKAADFVLPPRRARRVVISGDNDRPELYAPFSDGVDVLVHEATYTHAVALQVEPGPQHSSARQVAAFAAEQQIPNLVLTHFSQRYHNGSPGAPPLDLLRNEAQALYSGSLFLANDLDVFHLDEQGRLALNSSTEGTELTGQRPLQPVNGSQ